MTVRFTVEPILDRQRPRPWGDIDPATKNLTGNYNGKTEGAVKPEDSIVTEQNGYVNIVTLPPGVSPLDYIKRRLEELEAQVKEVNEQHIAN